MDILFSILLYGLAIGGLFGLALGLFILFHIVRPQRPPADESNRINKIRLIWFVLTRENLFVGMFPWLSRDELENVTLEVKARDRRTGRYRRPSMPADAAAPDMFEQQR